MCKPVQQKLGLKSLEKYDVKPSRMVVCPEKQICTVGGKPTR
ncbi:hypothetical protein [Orientia tsutsugamushi]|uniref:Uncharacterized protein n=1 Tax=Orientia tsutsugamushi str. TA716 TaxID=1359175 RepID=A0A0F3PA41_ORITS|nr:hypothetical protein [Orientia tsutsugamushi]KJV77158.1 hypothetical protein OTSTA716_0400 [Orientia tsutsugamushi str. TA716]